MPRRGYNVEGYRKYSSEERVAAILRSTTQDGCGAFKRDTIVPIFSDKTVDGIELHGTVAIKWIEKILGSLLHNKEIQNKLIMLVWIFYKQGKNLDEDELWHLIWMRKGMTLFSAKINNLPATGKVAPMDSWEKPEKAGDSDFDERQW